MPALKTVLMAALNPGRLSVPAAAGCQGCSGDSGKPVALDEAALPGAAVRDGMEDGVVHQAEAAHVVACLPEGCRRTACDDVDGVSLKPLGHAERPQGPGGVEGNAPEDDLGVVAPRGTASDLAG